jgi:hypothetical protein
MENYPNALLAAYRYGNIDRRQFCHAWAKLQGFDATVKGYGNKHGTFLTYRGRTARITNGLLVWGENHKTHTAKTIREMKIKVDYYEQQKVDYSKNDYPILTVDQQKLLFEIMRARYGIK